VGTLARWLALCAVATVCALGTAPGRAAAQTPPRDDKLAQAVELTKQGNEAKGRGEYDAAIARFEEAFALYPDPALQLLIGECFRLKGDATSDFEQYRVALTYFRKYVELAPTGSEVEAAKARIETLDKAIADHDAQQKAEQARIARDESDRREAEAEMERQRQADLAARQGTQIAVDGMVLTGLSTDLTAIPRGAGGISLNWGGFAVEAHLGFDFFFRLRGDSEGVAARTLTLDVGARYGLRGDRFIGPFVAAGGGFGLMVGSPRERRLEDDEETCMAQIGSSDCSFDLDKNLSARLGFGWGFAASERTTVAVRIDAGYWLFSVDGEQSVGSPPARFVERPQDALSLSIGLEFLRWL
jgi:hypothetical protein